MTPSRFHHAVITGAGCTEFSRESGRSVLELAIEAADLALADAGMERGAIDGMLTYQLGDSVVCATMARSLGLDRLRWHNDIHGGGSQCASILGEAALLIEAGLAETILIYRAMNGRSGKRMGQIGQGAGDGMEEQFLRPYGFLGPAHLCALSSQLYMHQRGLSADDLAELVIAQRAKAAKNPRALLRTPLTRDDYFAAPMIAEPLRRLDCCLETDAACALIVTSTRNAKSAAQGRPIHIRAAVRGGGPGIAAMDKAGADPSAIFSRHVAPLIYEAAGLAPSHIDLLQLYDAYSPLILQQLEDFGFCEPGELHEIVRDGRLAQNGRLPLNLNGGLLSEGYVHGLNNVIEAVTQLQGRAGERQTPGASMALCTGFGGSMGSAAILSVEP
ncbi:acetyl-CoA acetyltransferase [Sphingomonas sp. G-3-2-10]|uniref:thiolase C-terminal domain-containing protein n=1 Tax=Sphingomonas sp. G-3-2-10 TaxID=2728838 RepID=UPI001469F0CF|nr:acetyl-CoA acetyltransferase [Sphingomonas sp. G-3-2-10]NML08431.1 acetyl-CoA acetyltransferase [Sphingomonas sp. G-3-2-10]